MRLLYLSTSPFLHGSREPTQCCPAVPRVAMLHIFTEYLMPRELARAMPIRLPSLGKPEAWLLRPQAPGPTGEAGQTAGGGAACGPGMVTPETSCSWRWLLPSHSWLLPQVRSGRWPAGHECPHRSVRWSSLPRAVPFRARMRRGGRVVRGEEQGPGEMFTRSQAWLPHRSLPPPDLPWRSAEARVVNRPELMGPIKERSGIDTGQY